MHLVQKESPTEKKDQEFLHFQTELLVKCQLAIDVVSWMAAVSTLLSPHPFDCAEVTCPIAIP